MKTLTTLFTLASALVSVPALAANNADFVGPRVGVAVGTADVLNAQSVNNVTYNVLAGVDAPLSSFLTVGAEVDVANFFGSSRDIGAYARIGVTPVSKLLVYGKTGFSNFRNVPVNGTPFNTNGFAVGGGVEYSVRPHVYVGLEGLHTQYTQGVLKNAGAVTAGLRF